MGRRAQIALAAVVGVLLVMAAAAYAIDRANSDKIADGVRVGGVGVGGLSADQARHRLKAKLLDPLDKPVTVTFEGKKYVLSPDRLQLHADIDGMVDDALSASRSGGFPTRVWRYATGGSVDREIAPQISYSANALDGFVDEVAKQIDRAPQDATVAPTPLVAQPGRRQGRGHGADRLPARAASLRDRQPATSDRLAAGQADQAHGDHRGPAPRSIRSS